MINRRIIDRLAGQLACEIERNNRIEFELSKIDSVNAGFSFRYDAEDGNGNPVTYAVVYEYCDGHVDLLQVVNCDTGADLPTDCDDGELWSDIQLRAWKHWEMHHSRQSHDEYNADVRYHEYGD